MSAPIHLGAGVEAVDEDDRVAGSLDGIVNFDTRRIEVIRAGREDGEEQRSEGG